MSDRKEYTIEYGPPDSASEVHTIDTANYAQTSVPRGYARVANVSEDTNPTTDTNSAG